MLASQDWELFSGLVSQAEPSKAESKARMEVPMKPAASFGFLAMGVLVLSLTAAIQATPASQQAVDLDRALGKWHSTERFEDEPRISVSFRRNGPSIEGWAVLLGQHRKADDRATLGLSFANATWNSQSFRFSTILPEDEGTIGWELRVTTPTTAVLAALSEDGRPIQDELRWEMTK
jgi:hypothetical protein